MTDKPHLIAYFILREIEAHKQISASKSALELSEMYDRIAIIDFFESSNIPKETWSPLINKVLTFSDFKNNKKISKYTGRYDYLKKQFNLPKEKRDRGVYDKIEGGRLGLRYGMVYPHGYLPDEVASKLKKLLIVFYTQKLILSGIVQELKSQFIDENDFMESFNLLGFTDKIVRCEDIYSLVSNFKESITEADVEGFMKRVASKYGLKAEDFKQFIDNGDFYDPEIRLKFQLAAVNKWIDQKTPKNILRKELIKSTAAFLKSPRSVNQSTQASNSRYFERSEKKIKEEIPRKNVMVKSAQLSVFNSSGNSFFEKKSLDYNYSPDREPKIFKNWNSSDNSDIEEEEEINNFETELDPERGVKLIGEFKEEEDLDIGMEDIQSSYSFSPKKRTKNYENRKIDWKNPNENLKKIEPYIINLKRDLEILRNCKLQMNNLKKIFGVKIGTSPLNFFNVINKNKKTKEISKIDFYGILKHFSTTDDYVDSITRSILFDMIDIDSDSFISFDDFLRFINNSKTETKNFELIEKLKNSKENLENWSDLTPSSINSFGHVLDKGLHVCGLIFEFENKYWRLLEDENFKRWVGGNCQFFDVAALREMIGEEESENFSEEAREVRRLVREVECFFRK